ncbi:MAG: hypothetical protein IIC13_02645 [SAR324 cluster bacterium]|nr:hypothetical protein [SAR324 cluster bacterium]
MIKATRFDVALRAFNNYFVLYVTSQETLCSLIENICPFFTGEEPAGALLSRRAQIYRPFQAMARRSASSL